MNLREKNLSLITVWIDDRSCISEDPDPVVSRRAPRGFALALPRGGEDLDSKEGEVGRGIHRG